MQTDLSPSVCRAFLGCQIEKAVDELNLPKKIISCHPSNLPLPDHVDCFVALNRSPSCLEFSEALVGVLVGSRTGAVLRRFSLSVAPRFLRSEEPRLNSS